MATRIRQNDGTHRTLMGALHKGVTFPWNEAESSTYGFSVRLAADPDPVEPFNGPWQYAWVNDANGDGPTLETEGPFIVQLLAVDSTPIAEAVVDNAEAAIDAIGQLWASQWGQ